MVDPGRAGAVDPFGEQLEVVLLVAQQVAGAGAEQHADPRAIELAVEQAGVLEGLGRGHDAELLAARPAAALIRREARLEVERVDLAGDLAAERRHVEQRDRTQAAQAGDHVLPVGFAAGAERRDDADAGDGDAAIAPGQAHNPGSGSISTGGGAAAPDATPSAAAEDATHRASRCFERAATISGTNSPGSVDQREARAQDPPRHADLVTAQADQAQPVPAR